jgi:hypothetical protein
MQGKGRQRLKFPCFYFTPGQGILPAFGSFTGIHPLRPKKNDSIYIIADQKVLHVEKIIK